MDSRRVQVGRLNVLRFLMATLVVPWVMLAAGLANGQDVPAAKVELVIEDAPVVEQEPAASEKSSGFSLFKAVVDAVISPLTGNSASDSAKAAGTEAVAEEAPAEEGPPKLADATHAQESVVKIESKTSPAWSLTAFCALPDGRLIAAVGPNPRYGAVTAEDDQPKAEAPDHQGELQLLDADGKQTATWPLPFAPQTVNVAPDGSIYAGGAGKLAHLSKEGSMIACVDSPHVAESLKDPEKLRSDAEAELKQMEEQAGQMKSVLEQLEKQLAEQEQKKASQKEPAPALDATIAQLQANVEMYLTVVDQRQPKVSLDSIIEGIKGRLVSIQSLAVSETDLFFVTRSTRGYGYVIWRTKRDFNEPTQIVDSLSGCCGQMEIQCCDGCIFAAENSRHRVVKFDRDGQKLTSFGKRDRKGEGAGFGSCCNPMNVRFSPAGDLFTSESNGVVKRFSPEGKFLESVGVAQVTPGCKSSIIALGPDLKRVYYFDSEKSTIVLLDRKSAAADPANDQAAVSTK